MNHYAILEGTEIVGVVKTPGDYPGGTLLAGPIDFGSRPSESHKAHLVGGSVTWSDDRTSEQAWADARATRDPLLAASDWVTVRAIEQGTPVPEAWATYRQALRDITEQTDPFNITWPTAPQGA